MDSECVEGRVHAPGLKDSAFAWTPSGPVQHPIVPAASRPREYRYATGHEVVHPARIATRRGGVRGSGAGRQLVVMLWGKASLTPGKICFTR
jgi:hypothetical protein